MNESNLLAGSTYSYCRYESPIAKTAKLMTCLLLGGFGIFGNVFVIVLAVKYTVTKRLHFLIKNMAVADILVIIFCLLRYVVDRFLKNRIWNHIRRTVITQTLCKTWIFLYAVIGTESLVTLLVISIERYRSTRQTAQISRPLSGKRRGMVTAGCWIIVMLTNLHWLVYAEIERNGFEKGCIYSSISIKLSNTIIFVHSTLLLVYYLSVVVLSILTLQRISKPQAIEDSLSEKQRQQRRKRVRNAVKLVLYNLLLYSSCYGPFYITTVFLYFTDFYYTSCIYSWISFFAWFILPLLNSCLSPWIYCVCLSDFRKAARRLLCFGNTPSNARNIVVPTNRRYGNTMSKRHVTGRSARRFENTNM